MLDVGPAAGQRDADDLLVLVERLAAAGTDGATAQAGAQVRRAVEAGAAPPGLCRLAEALTSAAAELPPPQRHPEDDLAAVVAAVAAHPLVVLDDAAPSRVAEVLAALVADGRRVVVTATTEAELAPLRDAVRPALAGRVVDELPTLPASALRRMRRLLAAATPARRARLAQELPHAAALPTVDEVTTLCELATRPPASGAAELIPALVAELEPGRRVALTAVARSVDRALAPLGSRDERPWVWNLLADLVHTRHRAAFDALVEDAGTALRVSEGCDRTFKVTVSGPLPGGGVDALITYLHFLEAGGRARSRFRSIEQRDAEPSLRLIRVGGVRADDPGRLRDALEHIRLTELMGRVTTRCHEVGAPVPAGTAQLEELTRTLADVGAAARAVAALRHDVLFLHPTSPVAVPDVETATLVAAAILEYDEFGSPEESAERLDALATAVEELVPAGSAAPEQALAVAALRRRDAPAYAAAVDGLAAARREAHDEQRAVALLDELREQLPHLAEAWATSAAERTAAGTAGLGFAWFVRAEPLLGAFPPPDSADVVLVLGAARMGMERLLVAAAAPRLVAVVAPGERPRGQTGLLGVLQRASALVIGGGRAAADAATAGRVVQFAGPRPVVVVPAARDSVEQAGA